MEETVEVKVEADREAADRLQLEAESSNDAVTTPNADRTTLKIREPKRWIVRGNVIKPEMQEDLMRQDATMNYQSAGAVDRPNSVYERLNCGERVHIPDGVTGVVGETEEEKEWRQLASRATVPLRRLSSADIDKMSYTCGAYGTAEPVSSEAQHASDRPYECLTCGKAFKCRYHLVQHDRIHTGERPYPCLTCGKAFRYSANLVQHERSHTGERPFECTECGKAFRHRSSLMRHEHTHAGVRPFKCHTCGHAFMHRTSLEEHERTHTGERLHKCLACGRAFRHRSMLSEHERTHTAERPFECLTCGKAFRQRKCLLAHERVHSDERPYECITCDRAFRHRKNLVSHERIHSNEHRATLQMSRHVTGITKQS